MSLKRKRFIKRFSILFIIILFIALAIALGNKEKKLDYINLSNAEAKIELGRTSNYILLDVRSPLEYKEGRIPGSINIPVEVLETNVEKIIENKNLDIFVYCHAGNRSKEASKTLARLGYKNIYNLEGILTWEYEIEKDEE